MREHGAPMRDQDLFKRQEGVVQQAWESSRRRLVTGYGLDRTIQPLIVWREHSWNRMEREGELLSRPALLLPADFSAPQQTRQPNWQQPRIDNLEAGKPLHHLWAIKLRHPPPIRLHGVPIGQLPRDVRLSRRGNDGAVAIRLDTLLLRRLQQLLKDGQQTVAEVVIDLLAVPGEFFEGHEGLGIFRHERRVEGIVVAPDLAVLELLLSYAVRLFLRGVEVLEELAGVGQDGITDLKEIDERAVNFKAAELCREVEIAFRQILNAVTSGNDPLEMADEASRLLFGCKDLPLDSAMSDEHIIDMLSAEAVRRLAEVGGEES